jgi:hypothetical protein
VNKQAWMDMAEVSDAHRVRETAALAGYGVFVIYVILRILQFYFDAPPELQQSPAFAGFCVSIFTVVTGFSAPIFTTFNNAKRPWPQQATTSTAVVTTTSTGAPT